MSEKLISKGSALTLDKAVKRARSFEASQAQLSTMAGSSTNNSEVTWFKNKTWGKNHRETNHQILNPQEEHGYEETVVAPTIHLLTAQYVVRHVCLAKSQTTLLKSAD